MGAMERFRLDGRVAVVTGGVRGLGKVMAEALADAGASVAVTARDQQNAERVARELAASSERPTLGLGVEVANKTSVEAMVADVVEHWGRLDILVNNAGINIRRPIEQLDESEWDQVIDTNLKGAWLCCRAVYPEMKKRRWGRVINLSSMLAEVALPGRSPYCASKGGLTALTKVLALEWAADGINVNAICPGPFATELNLPLLNDPAARAAMESKVPLGRWGDPAELGPVAIFLASEASSYVTGASLFVDGGYTVQ
jgi:NAD(P)-dependent dehydrogenase (short-subunit alcohol dehydrogenase family)